MIIYLDMLCYNSLAMIASTLGTLSLATHTILTTFYSLMSTFTWALQVVLSNQVTHHLHNQRVFQSHQVIYAAFTLNTVLVTFIITFMVSK